MIVRLVSWLLKLGLSEKLRVVLLNAVNNAIDTPPLRAIITTDENRRILIQGKPASVEQLVLLRESAENALNSQARNLIHEQVRFMAIEKGFLQSEDPKTQLFYKAALWFAQEETGLLRQLAGTQDSTLSWNTN